MSTTSNSLDISNYLDALAAISPIASTQQNVSVMHSRKQGKTVRWDTLLGSGIMNEFRGLKVNVSNQLTGDQILTLNDGDMFVSRDTFERLTRQISERFDQVAIGAITGKPEFDQQRADIENSEIWGVF
jgi:hypothetical protein